MKRLGYPINRPVQSQAVDAPATVRVRVDAERFCEYPHFDDPLMQWHAALGVRDLPVTRLVWNDQGRGPQLVQFKYRKRPCTLNGLFELGIPRGDGNTAIGRPVQVTKTGPSNTALGLPVRVGATYGMGSNSPALAELQDVAQGDRLGTVRATIEGIRVPNVHWHTRDVRGTEGAVMIGDQEWVVMQFKGGATRATAHLGTEPERVIARLCAAVEAFEKGTVNTEVSARVRGTSRVFRRKF